MGLQIEGATGNGFGAAVNSENQLLTSAVMVTKEHEVNHDDGQAFSVFASLTPAEVTGAALGCFMYIKNTSETDMIVSEMMMYAASAETFSIKLGDGGTAVDGTTTTPANRNAGSGNVATGTFETGTNITGLSGGVTVFGFTKSTGSSERIAPASSFIVPKNKVLTVYVTTGNIAIRFGMGISYHQKHR